MDRMRKKRLVNIHVPGETSYDDDGFKVETPEKVLKVWCEITLVKPDEIVTYNVEKMTEILRCRCNWNAIRKLDPNDVYLTINGKKYELWGPFINEDMQNITGYFEAKRVT